MVSFTYSVFSWLKFVSTVAGLTVLSLKRLAFRRGLSTLALLSIALAVGLVSSAGFFAQAVDRSLLIQELSKQSQTTGRPPFSLRVYALPDTNNPLSLESAEQLKGNIAGTLSDEISLPVKFSGYEVHSGGLMLQHRVEGLAAGQMGDYQGTVNLAYIEGIAGKIDIKGLALDEAGDSGEFVDVWMHEGFAEKAGTNLGDPYSVGLTMSADQLPVRVAGVWRPVDATDPFWFTAPDLSLRDVLLVRRNDYVNKVQPIVASGSRYAAWRVILDERQVMPEQARKHLEGLTRSLEIISRYLGGAKLDVSPIKPLENFVTRNRTLTILLLGFNVPALGFLLYFLVLTSAIIARWQRREVAVLTSRGMQRWAVLCMTLIEQCLLFVLGVPLGLQLGLTLARVMGQTASFLTFVERAPMPVSLYGLNPMLVIGALAVTLLSRLGPAWSATRSSSVSEEREWARPLRTPFWYRYYLDLLLVAITAYAYYQLTRQGTLAMMVNDRPTDLYRDPLLILVPALFTLTGALLAMRIFTVLIKVMDWIASLVSWTTPHLALRQLGRESQSYINPLLLIMVALALGIYTFSLAASLDQWLVDRMYYQVGADVSFRPQPIGESSAAAGAQYALPIEEFYRLPGVQSLTPIADYATRPSAAPQSDRTNYRFLGIDRLTFPSVAWFREDFADESLGGLMNRLAARPDGILVPRKLLQGTTMHIGDEAKLSITLPGSERISMNFVIVGTYEYFPTVYENRPTFIGNFEYIAAQYGGPLPYTVWAGLKEGAKGEDMLKGLLDMGLEPGPNSIAQTLIDEELAKTERVGVFGTLSVGFLAASAMAIAGLLINTYASLNARLFRFSVLHALGLQRSQLLSQVLLEYLFLTAYGAAGGAFLGAIASYLFAPFFRVTGVREIPLPPLLPVIAQDRIQEIAIIAAVTMITLELIVIGMAISRRFLNLLRGVA